MALWTQFSAKAFGEPAYRQLVAFFKNEITLGRLKNGDRLPPIREIAEQSGVGLNTVRHALDLLVKEQLIHQTRGKGTFVAEDASQRMAAQLATAQIFSLEGIRVLILGPLSFLQWGDPRPFANLERQIKALGGTCRFQTEDLFHPLGDKRLNQLQREADAVVWFGMNGLHDVVTDELKTRQIRALNLPTVTAYSVHTHLFDGVDVNWHQGMWQAVEHLAQRGDQRIAFLGIRHAADSTQRFPWVTIRREAFLTACRYFGLQVDASDLWFADISQIQVTDRAMKVLRQAGQQLGKQLLQSKRPYTAIIGANDLLALGASDVLKQNGLSVPEDVAMIGFDDSADAMSEGLTTIAPQWNNDAKAAAQLLAKIIRQPEPDYKRLILSSPLLVVRNSTMGHAYGLGRGQAITPWPAPENVPSIGLTE